jgi:Flp pilus assembly protein TadG
MKHLYQNYSKGQVVIIVAISLVVLIGMVGLAIDSGRGYGVKAKLNAAVDAASIAAARALSNAPPSQQSMVATAAAIKFFHANYPDGYLGSLVGVEPSVTVQTYPLPPDCTKPYCGTTVTVTANADLPVTFMRVLNFDQLHVSATAVSARQTIDLAFVVDITGSMSSVGSTVKSRAIEFLQNHLNQSSDRVALISYNFGAMVNDQIRTTTRGFDFNTMKTHINNFSFNGNTNFGEGFWQARDQLNKVPTTPLGNRSTLRVILFFTDGSPNTFASTFPVRRMSTPNPACSGSTPTCNCNNSSNNDGFCTSPTTLACKCTCTGSLVTGDGSSGTPSGLYLHESTSGNTVSGTCNMGNQIISSGNNDPGIYQLPAWYNAPHVGANPLIPTQEFQIAPAPGAPPGLRTIATAPSFTSINRASRNLAEEMAWSAREEGIYVFVLGLGDLLHGTAGPDNERGERLLMCMANTNKDLGISGGVPTVTPDPRCYPNNPNPNQPVGAYCWAQNDPKVCYDKLASQILRLIQ